MKNIIKNTIIRLLVVSFQLLSTFLFIVGIFAVYILLWLLS